MSAHEDSRTIAAEPAGAPVRMERAEPALRLAGVFKRFGAVQALGGVGIECRAGEVHAIVGENGSGKSTLLGVASGVVVPDSGSVTVAGRHLRGGHPRRARALGLAMAYQTYSHVGALTVAENLVLAAGRHGRVLRRARVERWAAGELARLGLDIDVSARVAGLSLADRQFLEVAKALLDRPRVVLLDEPTTAFGPEEVARLHELVLAQAEHGVGFLYVSHRLPEVLGIAHRVTVLRDGRSEGTYDAADVGESDLLALMIGRPVELAFPPRASTTSPTAADEPAAGGSTEGRSDADSSAAALLVRDLRGPGFGPIALEVRRGEIVGVAGADGNGQTELLRAVAGVVPATGEVACAGVPLDRRSPRRALAGGVMFLSGERLRESLFPVASVRANATVSVLGRFARLAFVSRREESRAVTAVAAELKVRTPSIEQPVRFLSGGNQQKVVLSRLFLRDVAVLVVDEPTQGVDVRSRFEIYEALRGMADLGLAVLVKSSDPVELAGLCDRVAVVSRGRITEQIPAAELSEERIVGAFVQTRDVARGENGDLAAEPGRRADGGSWWFPAVVLAVLTVLAGAFTATRADAFLSEFNLNSLLLSALPLALLAMGQSHALVVGEFDLSVGALAGFVVVAASFLLDGGPAPVIGAGLLALFGLCVATGGVNAGLTRLLGIPSIIATVATLSVLQGVALTLRPTPGGVIDIGLSDLLSRSAGIVPYAFAGTALLAVGLDFWLRHTRGGLIVRACGYDPGSAVRIGLRAGRARVVALLGSAVFAGAAGLFLAAQVGVGDARIGGTLALASIAAAVLGGAGLSGGRGSFAGAVLGALFLTLIVNALPMLGWSSAVGDISRGAITLLALALFQGGAIAALVRRRRATP
ncbi:MAG TPA: ATP-binding cassette domain-containing protein [Streptosporangiaceae bacterium]|nr:ATP-binding cassette domain-containing protein [Streptosporangiaceae bacterium]